MFNHEPCTEKAGLSIIAVPYQKKTKMGNQYVKPSFGMALTIELYSAVLTDYSFLLFTSILCFHSLVFSLF